MTPLNWPLRRFREVGIPLFWGQCSRRSREVYGVPKAVLFGGWHSHTSLWYKGSFLFFSCPCVGMENTLLLGLESLPAPKYEKKACQAFTSTQNPAWTQSCTCNQANQMGENNKLTNFHHSVNTVAPWIKNKWSTISVEKGCETQCTGAVIVTNLFRDMLLVPPQLSVLGRKYHSKAGKCTWLPSLELHTDRAWNQSPQGGH